MILDNLGSHKGSPSLMPSGPQAQDCSSSPPDVTPIDHVFARLKHLQRKAAGRSKDAVWRSIGYRLDQVSPQGMRKLRTFGYGAVWDHPAPRKISDEKSSF